MVMAKKAKKKKNQKQKQHMVGSLPHISALNWAHWVLNTAKEAIYHFKRNEGWLAHPDTPMVDE